ncbi:hypothetical protein A2Y85_08655 [candidate division WOR-3 bacterium RBG_13_43_14]|uniref:Uncharacterized protein n=1 Tax=candidate division WOR-3 bacterium RBG_13_43_14 TaxID=1802590 RepID=A0A1F4U2S1_UNCW3|nr:MAG: hypothetical protein A2Y85_08655 [candidate division WOR-3 bacterium RBG_13_43_14]
MFQQLNEFKYTAATGKVYIVYFLKFWRTDDYFVKYQIRSSDKDFFWYGRMSEERARLDLKISKKEKKSIAKEDIENKIKDHLETLFVSVMKKGLDKGFEEPHTEFVFHKEPFASKRIHAE